MFLLVPLGHDQSIRRLPWVTIAIGALCVLVQAHDALLPAIDLVSATAQRWGYVPARGLSVGLITSAFVHDGWWHLLGNLVFLWLVGCNLEDRWGRIALPALFLAGSLASCLAFRLAHPDGEAPLVGASGGVSALMGAFLVTHARASIKIGYAGWLLRFFWGTFEVPAFVALPLWFLEQALYAWIETDAGIGVAYSAHVGGFAFGAAAALALRASGVERRVLLPGTARGVEWREDSDFVRALESSGTGRVADVMSSLRATLARNPSHPGALRELFRVGLGAGDADAVRQSASGALRSLAQDRLAGEVIDAWRAIEARFSDTPLSAHALAEVVRAAAELGAHEDGVRATQRLLREHPDSPLVPGVLWQTALLQEHAGRADLARKTLEHLARAHPLDPFAERARRRLASGP